MILNIDSIRLSREPSPTNPNVDHVVVRVMINGRSVEIIREVHDNYFDHSCYVGGMEAAYTRATDGRMRK